MCCTPPGCACSRPWRPTWRRGDRPDQILVLEHNPVFTLGRNATRQDIHVTDGFLRERGVEIFETDRGGQVTYHGPGQIVIYPICNLKGGREDVGRLVRGLEEAMIRTAADFGVTAHRLQGFPGIWVETPRGLEKLGALGLHLNRWITTHGIAFNVGPRPGPLPLDHPLRHHRQGRVLPEVPPGRGRPHLGPGRRPAPGPSGRLLALDPQPTRAPQPQRLRPHLAPGARRPADSWSCCAGPNRASGGQSVTGMMEPGETPEAAAHRELMEETGLTGTLRPLDLTHSFWMDPQHPRPARTGEPRFNTETCFAMEVAPAAVVGWPWTSIANTAGAASRRPTTS